MARTAEEKAVQERTRSRHSERRRTTLLGRTREEILKGFENADGDVEKYQKLWSECDTPQKLQEFSNQYPAILYNILSMTLEDLEVHASAETNRATQIDNLQKENELKDMDIQTLHQKMADVNKNLQELKNELAERDVTIRTLQRTASMTPGGTVLKSDKFEGPYKFDNGDSTVYSRWERQMREKLKYNHDRFVDEGNKVAYMSLRTTGEAAKYMENFLQGPNAITTVEGFLNKMRGRFGGSITF